MNENLKALMARIAGSEELLAKFAELDTAEKAYEFARTLQDGFTQEEFLDAVEAFSGADGSISDEDLAAAAGGTGDPETPQPMTTGVATGGCSLFAPGASPKYRTIATTVQKKYTGQDPEGGD